LYERVRIATIVGVESPMIARRLHHASFPVSDLERALAFYEGVLGLEPIERPDLGFPGAWFRAGGCEVHLIVPFEGMDVGKPPVGLNPMAVHTAFTIADYSSVVARLKEAGLEVLELGEDAGQMWVCDPDGNTIELIAAE
jgi:glyoxylase I family protein